MYSYPVVMKHSSKVNVFEIKCNLMLLSPAGRGRESVEKIGNTMFSFIKPGFHPSPSPPTSGREELRLELNNKKDNLTLNKDG